jgi:hypothetical protein
MAPTFLLAVIENPKTMETVFGSDVDDAEVVAAIRDFAQAQFARQGQWRHATRPRPAGEQPSLLNRFHDIMRASVVRQHAVATPKAPRSWAT